ncbi:Endonuclease, Uma2 family (restriction endonuclease fold) [Mesobacillus persicus]|uniref:Endonuclease, Uma2 family (Restriction endonuclease fold) n=1 Tax=Mesobacillus persicus TaxID=930146 RepID=A0A1H8B2T5_9BACI|nr:Uma2 family endonuclease [Mesobacillus persicus]SEM77221.1 Endonuclease, Uma2 family (restriction endonuclease fold) [Mesobacillus persicus]
MDLYKNEQMPVKDYFRIRENSEQLFEYIDGFVYMSPSPSTRHQRISSKLHIKLGNFLRGKSCEVFHAPFDIELKRENIEGTKIVIPDLTVICDKAGFTESRYIGVPNFIIEILSPTNQSHDLITKLNIYMNYGVQEYWIVNPMLNSVTVYSLDEKRMYEQHDMKTESGRVKSKFLSGFSADLQEIF